MLFAREFYKALKTGKPAHMVFSSPVNELRSQWLKSHIFMSEHSNYSTDAIDRMEIIDFLLLIKECEQIADAKRKAYEG